MFRGFLWFLLFLLFSILFLVLVAVVYGELRGAPFKWGYIPFRLMFYIVFACLLGEFMVM